MSRRGWAAEAFAFASPAAVWREYAGMTALAARHGKLLDLTAQAGLSDAAYDALEPFTWGGAFPLADRFPTPSGKARLVACAPPVAEAVDAAFPLRLNTGRYRDQWHTMTRTGLSPTLSQHRREPLLEVHPRDADAAGLVDGGLARVVTAAGAAVFRVSLSDGQRRGDVFVPMHWTDVMAGEGRSNRLPGQSVDPVSGQPGFKSMPARVEPVLPEWRAFLVARDMPELAGLLWWTCGRVSGGWLCELAGMGAIDADALLPAGERIEAADHARGMRRIAVRDAQGVLLAALYATRSGRLPAREWAAASSDGRGQRARRGCAAQHTRAGSRADRVHLPWCWRKGHRRAALAGARTVEAIGGCTRAGTNCGSCRPAIARLLAATLADEREAAE